MYIKNLFEVRGHARGGQGMVTAFEILAKIFSFNYNYKVQAFPFFGVERTGAPIQAFLRISPDEILKRCNVYHPHFIVVFDEGLIAQVPVFNGLTNDGIILINTDKEPSFYRGKAKNIFTVPATKISLEQKLGSKALPIVNAAMIGAMIKILNMKIENAKKIIRQEVPAKPDANAQAAEIAFHRVLHLQSDENRISGNGKSEINYPVAEITSPVPFWDKPMSLNKTGNWRVFMPQYLNRQPPCTDNCPAGTDVRLFIKLASEKKFDEAYKVIYKHNPFPSICGRVCPHFCQQNCNRNSFDEKLNIGAIERFIGDDNSSCRFVPDPVVHKEKIAVIGSGPAGLTAALRLRRMGYEVIVFEALPKAGGMMRAGIPEFRLPEKILNKEIWKITEQGVKIILNKKVAVGELEDDFSAILVAAGLHIGTSMNIENENEIMEGIQFLREIKFNSKGKFIRKDDSVAVIGGGNTAIDVARTVLRLGGKPIIYYRRTQQEMPAIAHEVEESLKEGVKIEFLTAPVKVKKNKNGRLKVTLVKMKLGEADESGRRKPVPIRGSEKNILADKVIKATGQKYDGFVFGNEKVNVMQGKISFGKIPVFCCGDMAWGGTVVEAIGSGNEAAKEMDAFLKKAEYKNTGRNTDKVLSSQMNFNYYIRSPSVQNPFMKTKKLFNNYLEVTGGLSCKQIAVEAGRCLHCGECYLCGNCFNFCPDAAVSLDVQNRLQINYDYCKGCGICVHECPCAAIRFEEDLIPA